MRTIRFPSRIVPTACHQFIPPAIRPDASMYVGIHTLIATHSDT
jgi:hypothetical protein